MTRNTLMALKQYGHIVSPSIADWKSKSERGCVCVCICVWTATVMKRQCLWCIPYTVTASGIIRSLAWRGEKEKKNLHIEDYP